MNLLEKNILIVSSCLFAGYALADQPLWEVGAGIAALNMPSYRGANQSQNYALPIPYVTYHGDFLKIEREQVRGLILKEDNSELDISVNGTFPVDSRDNQARFGMPDLYPTLEIGPSLNLSLFKSVSKDTNIDLRLPLRPVFASNFSKIMYVGWIFQPQLNLDLRNTLGFQGWNIGLLIGPIVADAKYHQYFYGVDPMYATPSRQAYQARGGYAGAQFIAAISKHFKNYWVGGFLKLDNIDGAVFANSPLVGSNSNVSAGFAISWIFDSSKIIVKVDK
jgi:outer membrane protein